MSVSAPRPAHVDPRDPDLGRRALVDGELHPEEKARQVASMFGAIAARYDLLNTVLSFGLDRLWRREAARVALAGSPRRILDVATGTGDLALALKRTHPHAEVTGVDFSDPMLAIARDKARRSGLRLTLEPADGTALPYPDASFDAVTIAYGLRNFSSYQRGLAEFRRVLRPGGRLVVLEFPPPPRGWFGRLFRLYFFHVVPFVGRLLCGDAAAYRYLPTSVLAFPDPDRLAAMMIETGFVGVRYRLQSFGISALHVAEQPR